MQNLEVPSDRRNDASAAAVVFVALVSILVRLCSEAAGIILLVWIYGRRRVFGEHLRIVQYKPNLIASNGDILYGRAFEHYLIGVCMWLVASAGFLSLAFRLLPRYEREALEGRYTVSCATTLAIIALFFAIGLLPLAYSALLAGSTLVIVYLLSWMKESRTDQL